MGITDLIEAANASHDLPLPPADERRSIRHQSGVPAAEIAVAVGVSVDSLKRWERGQHAPQSAAVRRRYASVLQALQAV